MNLAQFHLAVDIFGILRTVALGRRDPNIFRHYATFPAQLLGPFFEQSLALGGNSAELS